MLFWPEISVLGVFLNFDNERMHPPKYLSDPPGTFVCFCLFVWDPQPHFSRGVNSQRRTYGDHPRPPRPLVTPGPCVSVCSLSPHTFVLNASCIRSVPSPVLLSYTYTLSSLWSVSLSYTYIQTPQERTPQHISNPTNKRC